MTPYLVTFGAESDVYEFLARLNSDGHNPELPAFAELKNATGHAAFLMTLTDPDADHVHYVVTDESGTAHKCYWDDEPCTEWDPCHWRPNWPVTALSPFDPEYVHALIAEDER